MVITVTYKEYVITNTEFLSQRFPFSRFLLTILILH